MAVSIHQSGQPSLAETSGLASNCRRSRNASAGVMSFLMISAWTRCQLAAVLLGEAVVGEVNLIPEVQVEVGDGTGRQGDEEAGVLPPGEPGSTGVGPAVGAQHGTMAVGRREGEEEEDTGQNGSGGGTPHRG